MRFAASKLRAQCSRPQACHRLLEVAGKGANPRPLPMRPPSLVRFASLLRSSCRRLGCLPSPVDALTSAWLSAIPSLPTRTSLSPQHSHHRSLRGWRHVAKRAANAEISTVSCKTPYSLDVATLWIPQLLGASPSFHSPEGGKAVELRIPVVVRRFAGFSALAPSFKRSFLGTLPTAPLSRRGAGLSYQLGLVGSRTRLRSPPAPPEPPDAFVCDSDAGFSPA